MASETGVAGRVGKPGLGKALARSRQASHWPQWLPSGGGIVAAVAQRRVEAEPLRLARDVGLGHVLERRVDGEPLALDPGLGREVGQLLERAMNSGRQSG